MPLAFGEGGPAVVRAALKAQAELPGSQVVAVPLAPREDVEIDLELREHVARNYGATEHYAGPAPIRIPGPPHRRGLVVFFTGLSGSGKSTVARGCATRCWRRAPARSPTSTATWSGALLSKGLTFSAEDRDLNIRRIGYVASEVARHGGLAICARSRPTRDTRDEAREMAEEVGADFLLVWISTPLEECERRDRKGLYAKAARRSDPRVHRDLGPSDEPEDADLEIDTTGLLGRAGRLAGDERPHGRRLGQVGRAPGAAGTPSAASGVVSNRVSPRAPTGSQEVDQGLDLRGRRRSGGVPNRRTRP